MKEPFKWTKELWNYLFQLQAMPENKMTDSQKRHFSFFQEILAESK
jgi:hypothetical protein